MPTIIKKPIEGTLSTIEAARLLNVAEMTVRRWDERGMLKSIRDTLGRRRFDKKEIEKFKKQREKKQ